LTSVPLFQFCEGFAEPCRILHPGSMGDPSVGFLAVLPKEGHMPVSSPAATCALALPALLT